MRVIGLAGWSGAGKTTLLVRLIPVLRARGLRVATLKHAHHAFDVDQPGKDSFRHREAGACEVIVSSRRRTVQIREVEEEARLPELLRLGEGESKSGGKLRPSILADALEAIIGAVYLDAGYDQAEALVHRLLEGVELSPRLQEAAKDAKTALQEWLQGRKMKLPQYQVIDTTGAAHNQVFHVECLVAELQLTARGSGASRRAAEQAAASAMLAQLKVKQA